MPTLEWLNRAEAFSISGRVPYRLLEQASVHSSTVQPEPAGAIHDNLLIQGDNLEALKALLPLPGFRRRAQRWPVAGG